MNTKCRDVALVLLSIISFSVIYAKPAPKPAEPFDAVKAEKACTAGDIGTCFHLATHKEKHGDVKGAMTLYGKTCLHGDSASCIKTGDYHESQQDPKEAMRWFRAECLQPSSKGEGCRRVAELAISNKSQGNAKRWFRKACDKGDSASCNK
jgi:TPR repeat protein